MIFLLAHKFVSNPNDASSVTELHDTPETWATLLDTPEVVADEIGKESASVLCGARYFSEATTRDKEGIDGVVCLVLDVDAGSVPSEEALRANLEGLRAIVYTSPSHTAAKPRWRVLLPLLTPLPPKKHRSLVKFLSEHLVPGHAGCIDVDSTGDPGRLGFVGVTKHPLDYKWWSQPGTPLDWTSIPLDDELWVQAPLGGLERSALWTDRETALKAALKRFATHGQGIGRGQGRTMALWEAANQLWWAWAAEDEEFVMTVLRHINTNFTDPEDEDELLRKMRESHQRTIGERRKEQSNGGYGWAREPSNVVSVVAIANHAKRLRQRQSPELALVGEALKRLAKGDTLSDDPDTWRGLVTKCAHEMARAFPSETAERIAQFFRPSLSTMRAAGALLPTIEEIHGYIGARLKGIRKAREELLEKADSKIRQQIEYVTGGDRSTKYTKQEIETWRQSVGLRDNNWILVSKNAYFVFRNGTWVGAYTEKEFEAQGYKDLAAADPWVRTQVFNEQKGTWTNAPIQRLLHEYGSRCNTRCDLNCDRTWFNEEEHTLVLAGPPRREISPRFHNEVDEWLRVMTGRPTPINAKVRQTEASATGSGDDYDTLCDWLACVTRLDHPCAALYLQGEHSVGKGLFADGVARIWKTGAIPLEDAFDDFNSLLSETPFIWVDEALPERVRASVLLRKALAAREFVYKRKYMDAGKMTGCLRMLFTANNLDLFNKSRELVKKEDIDALAQRFVHILVRPEAAAYLQSISPRHHAFVESNMIAEHALWLQDKRWGSIKTRGLRFLVEGQNTNVSDVVATNSESTSDCCNAICETIVEQRKSDWCVVKNSEIYVNVPLLKRHMALNLTAKRYDDREIARAMSSISEQGLKVVRHNKKPTKMRKVRKQALMAWCNNTLVYDWIDVKSGIAMLSKNAVEHDGALMNEDEVPVAVQN